MMEKRWAQAPGRRDQLLLFGQTLDDAVAADHPIRVLDRCLDGVDWGPWEARYAGRRGQPPIHPRLLAGAILYGLLRKIRSSRELEDATRERVDFMWLLEGRTIDHSTFAEFRTEFGEELKGLHRQIATMICDRVEQTLLALVIDGTRERANSNRYGARTAQGLERMVGACVRELDRRLARMAEHDEQGTATEEERAQLRREVETLRGRVAQLEKALEVARTRDARKREIMGSGAEPVRVPVTDPDAQIVPNKEGGYAPNFTPTVAVDPASRMIVHADVLEGSEENTAVLPAVEAAKALGGELERVLADSGFASGENLERLETDGIEAYMPTNTDFRESNPANREDPTQPVPESQWEQLPKRGKQLAGAAFVYDAAQDCYFCPMGRTLRRLRKSKQHRTGIAAVEYQCPGSAGCPLAGQCVKKGVAARMVTRDQYQDVRDRVGRRMATPEGHAVYRKRAPVVEGVFAEIKHLLGIRRFLLRGLDKVRIEWTWICAAFNLKRLLALLTTQGHRPQPNHKAGAASGPDFHPGLLLSPQPALLRVPFGRDWGPGKPRLGPIGNPQHQVLLQTG
jgi:transposase